jgi:hypothetical protein
MSSPGFSFYHPNGDYAGQLAGRHQASDLPTTLQNLDWSLFAPASRCRGWQDEPQRYP